MRPKKLHIKNFSSYAEAEICFDDFNHAIIVGKIRGNERFSNGAGKSSIFNAIEYVLFNEIKCSALEKIIRDGCESCSVKFDFISSIDNGLYQIVRSNSHKSGTDVRLFRKNKTSWEDLSQRRASDTEKEIVKIIGFNYKAFCASALFSQAGSENNIQKDYGNLPALTPEKRKAVLREILQLGNYILYEKAAKNKYAELQANLEKNKILLSTIGDPDQLLQELNDKLKHIIADLKAKNNSLLKIKQSSDELQKSIASITHILSSTQERISYLNQKKEKVLQGKSRYLSIISEFSGKLSNIPNIKSSLIKELGLLEKNIERNNLLLKDNSSLTEKDTIVASIIEKQGIVKSSKIKIEELNVPIPQFLCRHCRQTVSEEHRIKYTSLLKEDIQKLVFLINETEKEIIVLQVKKKSIEDGIRSFEKMQEENTRINMRVALINKELEHKNILTDEYTKIIQDNSLNRDKKEEELLQVSNELNDLANKKIENLLREVNKLKQQYQQDIISEKDLTHQIQLISNNQAVLQYSIKDTISNKEKKIQLTNELLELEKSLTISFKVVQAFGSSGIPSFIIHTVLDELQVEANRRLAILRPGLQLQFVIVKDKTNGDKDDTLDILYYIDGQQREYRQLSGAQKITISLSIKLALLFIMNKRLGIDIKFMLLDEVDQALDDGGTEIFSEMMKMLQDEFKILIITHNNELKHKFSQAIVVEQDENNISTATLTNW